MTFLTDITCTECGRVFPGNGSNGYTGLCHECKRKLDEKAFAEFKDSIKDFDDIVKVLWGLKCSYHKHYGNDHLIT